MRLIGSQKFIRSTVAIDQSAKNSNADANKEPDFSNEIVFLKVLIEGKASLYKYGYNENALYFYQQNDGEIKQLVFKKYQVSRNSFGTNKHYRQQLWMNFRCPESSIRDFELIDYTEKELIKHFKKYNECTDSEYIDYSKFETGVTLNLTIRPGINRTSVSIKNQKRDKRDLDFGSATNFRMGIEAEVILPFHKDKLGIFIEPTYQYFDGEQKLNGQEVTFDYQSIEVPFGVRHYFFLNKKSKIFVNAAAVIDLSWNSVIEHELYSDLFISGNVNLALGVGYMFNDCLSAEFRYYSPKHILSDYPDWRSYYNTSSFILGYTLF